ncbi:MAG: DUF1638 domain-containing protein [Opitutales bacterium]
MHNSPKFALLACSVFEEEIELHAADATHIQELRFFEIGLHDQPDVLRETLQGALEELDAREDIEAVALAYGLCGLGTAGLQPQNHPLVIPRAHDCITVFMGTKERYADWQKACPNCYYYTPGWNRNRRVPGPEKLEALREELSERFDPEDVAFLLDSEKEHWTMYDTAVYLDLGTAEAESEADYARRCADWLGWRFQRLKGNAALLRDLLWGRWDDERFQIIEPGSRLGSSGDEKIMRSEPAKEAGDVQ